MTLKQHKSDNQMHSSSGDHHTIDNTSDHRAKAVLGFLGANKCILCKKLWTIINRRRFPGNKLQNNLYESQCYHSNVQI